MKQIKIGTCIQGPRQKSGYRDFWEKDLKQFSLNFHMSLEGTDLEQLAGKTEKLLEGRPERISTIGFYCNPIQYPEHRKTLEQVIRTAGRFGADHVSTFAGAFEDRPVEESFAEFGKVFRELADLAKENGVKLGIENCLMDGTWEKATCNIGFHPRAWEAMFEEVKQDNFGLEWEPTHQMVQLIDPVSQLRNGVIKSCTYTAKMQLSTGMLYVMEAFQGRRLLYGTECRALATQTGAILFLS